jgi:putative DNA primase/helicase
MPRDADDPVPVSLASLANDRVWVAWQTEDRDDGKEITKVPYSPKGCRAKAGVASTWGTRAEAEAFLPKLPKPYGEGGIGLEFTANGNGLSYAGADLDTCRDPETGAVEPWAAKIVRRLNTYGELSPSHRGLKLFFVYTTDDLPALRAAMGGAKYGRKFSRDTGQDHPPAIEIYFGNRYFCVTEEHLPGTPADFRHIPLDTLLWVLKEAGPAFARTGKQGKPESSGGSDNSRSAKAFRKAVKLKRAGKSFEEMCQALREDPETAQWVREKGEANDCRELRRLWERADDAAGLASSGGTEDEIATRFADRFKNLLRYCHDTDAWFEWDGGTWRKQETQLAFHWARHTCREAARANPRLKCTIAKASTAGAVERFARADPAFAVTARIWDRNPYLLGTPAGTMDLHTGRLQSAIQTDYITKSTTVAPAETPKCPLWLQFLDDVTRSDKGLIRFLRQWCGYGLTGDTREHALLFIFGPGGNGKSVFLRTVSRIMGDYATVAAMDTFTASNTDRHPTDLAMLRGARLVCVSETEEGRAWAENRIKNLTGGDQISARFLHKNFFTYRPQFKITIIGNHKPVLRNVDEANRRRLNFAPFIHKPPNPDRDLGKKLEAEYPAILRWMIDGCIEWQAKGLIRPPVVTSATSQYFADQDTTRQWIEACCETTDSPPHVADTSGSLFASWRAFAMARGEEVGTSRAFSTRLQNFGYEQIKDEYHIRGRGYRGIKVRLHHETEAWENDGEDPQ